MTQELQASNPMPLTGSPEGITPEHSRKDQVEILLATYNGEQYLAQQIDSLLQQDYPEFCILARDDGSRDKTLLILQRYADLYPNRMRVLGGDSPSGSPKDNFAQLMSAATAPYIMFSDQDDVWDRDKVSASMAAMHTLVHQHGSDVPLMVFSDLQVVNADLSVRHPSFWKQQGMNPDAVNRLRPLLSENVVAGCTALINRPLLRLALPVPKMAYMHDWWIALLASLFGHSAYLRRTTLRYRQHEKNAVGAAELQEASHMPRWNDHQARQGMWEQSYSTVQALWQQHGAKLSAQHKRLITAFLSCNDSPSSLKRVVTLVSHRFFRRGLRPNLAILWYLWNKDALAKRG